MLKVVLDTNIFVSSIFWNGNPRRIIEKVLDKEIEVLISADVIKELEKVLRRDFEEPEEYVQRQINLVRGYSEIINPTIRIDVVKEDPDDNKFIECAVEGKADYIVTGDDHLKKLKEYGKIKIITPAEFLGILNKKY